MTGGVDGWGAEQEGGKQSMWGGWVSCMHVLDGFSVE